MTLACFLIALAWSIFAWFKPKLAVFWLPMLFPAYVLRTQIGPIPTTALELTFVATAIIATRKTWKITWKIGFEKLKPFYMAGGMWIAATIIAIFVAPNHVAALGLWRAFVLEPILFAVLVAGIIETEQDKKQIISALIWSVISVTAVAVAQFASGKFIPHPWDTSLTTRRATGPFPYPNALSLYVAPIAALCVGLFISPINRNKKEKILLAAGFIAGLTSIILAKSVGGFIGLLVAVTIALILDKRTRYGTIFLSFFAFYAIVNSPLQAHIASTLSFGEWSGRVRAIMWDETIQMLSKHEFLGAGFGAYPTAIVPFHRATWMEIFQYPHNILLNIWSETGLLGIVAFTGLCLTWMRICFKKDSEPSPTAYSLPLIAILAHGLVDVPYFKNDLALIFWILLVLVSTQEPKKI